jgi:hypothetical protein
MARFDFQSPGAAFTGQIAEQLAERKATERQRMLDQLTMNADSRAAEAAQRQQAESEAQLADMAHRKELQDLDVYRSGLRRGQTPTNPQVTSLLDRYGLLEDLPSPQVSTATEFSGADGTQMEGPTSGPMEQSAPVPPRRGYVGSLLEQEKDRLRANTRGLIDTLMAKPETRQDGEFIAKFALANDGIADPGIIAHSMAPGKAGVVFDVERGIFKDASGKTITGNLPSNAHVVTQSRPPRELRPRSWIGAGVEPGTGNSVFIDPDDIDRMTGQPRRFVIPGTSKPSSGAAGRGSALGIPATYLDDLDNAERALGYDPRSVDEQAFSNYRGSLTRGFGAASYGSPAVKAAAQMYIQNPEAAAEMIDKLIDAAPDRASMERIATEYNQYLGAIPPHVKEMLKNNPYVANKPEEPSYLQRFLNNIRNGKKPEAER